MPFVSVEGIDGSGKTEQVGLLVERLRGCGHTVLQTKEPDGGHLGAEIRAILTRPDRNLSPTEQLLLVSAARYDHVRSVIQPALDAGRWVVSDRFFDSTYAFQVAISDRDLAPVFRSVSDVVVGNVLPDVTIILDVPVEIACARRRGRDPMIADPLEAHRDFDAIRRGLLARAANDPARCHVIDGDQTLETVSRDIWRAIEPLL